MATRRIAGSSSIYEAPEKMTDTNQKNTFIPVEIGRANQYDVKIRWQDGHESVYPARELRLACPCAGCVDEVTGQLRLIATSVPQNVYPLKIDLVGRYAINIQWSDGHNTGIYSYEKLRKMCPCCSDKQHATSNKA
jgi:DUF971 family protein